MILQSEYMAELKKQYVYAHLDPLHLHHLYAFLVYRYREDGIPSYRKIPNIFPELTLIYFIHILKSLRQ